jgi:hypothetical protein
MPRQDVFFVSRNSTCQYGVARFIISEAYRSPVDLWPHWYTQLLPIPFMSSRLLGINPMGFDNPLFLRNLDFLVSLTDAWKIPFTKVLHRTHPGHAVILYRTTQYVSKAIWRGSELGHTALVHSTTDTEICLPDVSTHLRGSHPIPSEHWTPSDGRLSFVLSHCSRN